MSDLLTFFVLLFLFFLFLLFLVPPPILLPLAFMEYMDIFWNYTLDITVDL